MSILLKPTHWRIIAIQLLATPFLILGARQLHLIRFAGFVEQFQRGGVEALKHSAASLEASEVSNIAVWAQASSALAWLLAILITSLVSAYVVWRRRESWLIPLLVFAGAIISSWTHYYKSPSVYSALALLRWPFERFPIETRLGLVGGALITVGIALLLWPLRWCADTKTAGAPQIAA